MAEKSVEVPFPQSKSKIIANVSSTFKIVVLGGDNVGKSNLVERYVNDKDMNLVPNTIGGFNSLSLDHCRGEYAAIVVYDITNIESFYEAINWIKTLAKVKSLPTVIKLVGNKADLESRRAVDLEKVNKFCKENNIDMLEASARTGSNVENVFSTTIEDFLM